MRLPSPRLPMLMAWLPVAVLLGACAAAPREATRTPEWLNQRIADYERRPANEVPSQIWRITHQGMPAFYVVSPCCDQFNPLFDAGGRQMCSPSGGFTGAGDGKCPRPMDPGTAAVRVWVHPAQDDQDPASPDLGGR